MLGICLFEITGLFFVLLLVMKFRNGDVKNIKDYFGIIVLIIISASLLYYCIHFLKRRIQGKCFFWDDEGVVVDVDENKIYWHEIEKITFSKGGRRAKSTIIDVYAHYRQEAGSRIEKRQTWVPKSYSIEWMHVTHAKEFHQSLMEEWGKRQKKSLL